MMNEIELWSLCIGLLEQVKPTSTHLGPPILMHCGLVFSQQGIVSILLEYA